MIQAIVASQNLETIQRRRLLAPTHIAELQKIPTSLPDRLELTTAMSQDADALAALQYLQEHVGRLHKPGFFSNPRIDAQEALSRLKDGKSVLMTNHNTHDVRDSFDSFKELFMVDDLLGRRQDHGVTKPELRLPLLFLDNHTLSPYRSDQSQPYHDAYTAYQELDRNWRIRVDDHAVKPDDLAAYVVNKGWTQSLDAGLAILKRAQQLPAQGWQINGKAVDHNVAYMALLTGGSKLSYQGAVVENMNDFSLLMNLVAGEANHVISDDLRERLLSLNLKEFSSPGLQNFYTVYKHLAANRALSYQGNTLGSLNDVIIYDALEGSHKATPLLNPKVQEALLYLGQDGNLQAYKTYRSLQQGENINYTFVGGSTGEAIQLQASNLEELVVLKNQVVSQRERDRFRPDFGEAKDILLTRLPGFLSPLKSNQETMNKKAEKARQDIPIQQENLEIAHQDYRRIKPEHDRALQMYEKSQTDYQSAEREYQSRKRDYDWARDRYERVQRDYDWAHRQYDDAMRSVAQYEAMARREEQLATSDPNNAATHRQKATQYRSQATSYRRTADRHYSEMRRLEWDVRRLRDDMQQAEYRLGTARRDYYDAERLMNTHKNDWQRQKSLLNDATGRIQAAESKLASYQQTLVDADAVQQLTGNAEKALNVLQQLSQSMKNYSDYAHNREALHQAIGQLQQALSTPLYQKHFGNILEQQLAPLSTLLSNMDKPAL